MSAILKHSNHWKWALKMNFKRSGYSQFSEAVVTSTVKEKAYALLNVVQYKFSLIYRGRKCRVESTE